MTARDSMREVLRHVFDQVDMHQRAEGKKAHLPKEIFDCSLAAITLLQVRLCYCCCMRAAQALESSLTPPLPPDGPGNG